MEHSYVLSHVKTLIKQRNVVLVISGLMLITNLLLSTGLVMMRREVIMVPGITQEYRIAGSKVSSSYLEEMTHMFLSGLLDLTPENVFYKKELVLKYTLAGSMQTINKYFAEAQVQHEQFKFSTYFSVKQLEISLEKMEVIARGILNSRFGRQGNEEKEAEYLLKYQMIGGILRLKSFSLVDKEAEKRAQEMKKNEQTNKNKSK
jgi:type IV conjugative transfer system protein TraE